MKPIQDLLNKLKWDTSEHPEEYTFFYFDRVEKILKELRYKEILKIEEGFLYLLKNGEEVAIPLHRIKKVIKNNVVIWERVIEESKKQEKD